MASTTRARRQPRVGGAQSSRRRSPPGPACAEASTALSAASDRIASVPGPVVGEDGLARCPWGDGDPVMRDYHDTEWGVPVSGESAHLERLTLEAFQSGLSWRTILLKRPAFREAFADFDADLIAAYDERDVVRLMADTGIVRNLAKVNAAITNARATVGLRDHGGLADLIAAHRPEAHRSPRSTEDLPARTPESQALSKALKKVGFVFVGPTTMYALMEAIGIVDDHLAGCHRHGSGSALTYQPVARCLLDGAQGRRRRGVVPCGAPLAHHPTAAGSNRRPSPSRSGARSGIRRHDRTHHQTSTRQRLASRHGTPPRLHRRRPRRPGRRRADGGARRRSRVDPGGGRGGHRAHRAGGADAQRGRRRRATTGPGPRPSIRAAASSPAYRPSSRTTSTWPGPDHAGHRRVRPPAGQARRRLRPDVPGHRPRADRQDPALGVRLQRLRGACPARLGPLALVDRPHGRSLVSRYGGARRRGRRPARPRQRRRRLDPDPGGGQRTGRAQADARPARAGPDAAPDAGPHRLRRRPDPLGPRLGGVPARGRAGLPRPAGWRRSATYAVRAAHAGPSPW